MIFIIVIAIGYARVIPNVLESHALPIEFAGHGNALPLRDSCACIFFSKRSVLASSMYLSIEHQTMHVSKTRPIKDK